MNKEKLLASARDHCFFIGVNDSGAELCKVNAVYGIAGMHYLQKELGLPPRAFFISSPDMTITRNTSRWESGFGYGGRLSWGDGTDELVVLNAKPNACGMLVGGLHEMPDVKSLIERLHEMESKATEIDGIEVEWDFYKSNHFVDIFIMKPVSIVDDDYPPYAFIIHGSAAEFTGDNLQGPGLYWDRSKQLFAKAQSIQTPFQELHYLVGDEARKYFELYQKVDSYSKKKRRLAAEMLFGDYTEISNENHQGMINMNEMILGCHHFNGSQKLYPFALRGDLPAYIVRPVENLKPEIIEILGFKKRAKKLGLYDKLLTVNIIPHGGGYVLPDILTVNRVIEVEDKRYFEVEMKNDRGKKIISEVRDLPYDYRGREVVLRSLEIGIMDIAIKLIPQYVFKI